MVIFLSVARAAGSFFNQIGTLCLRVPEKYARLFLAVKYEEC